MLRRSPTASLSRASHVEPVCKCGKELKLEQRYRDRLDRYHRQFHELERSANFLLLLLPNTKYLEETRNEDPLASKKISIFPREREGLKQEGGGKKRTGSVADSIPPRWNVVLRNWPRSRDLCSCTRWLMSLWELIDRSRQSRGRRERDPSSSSSSSYSFSISSIEGRFIEITSSRGSSSRVGGFWDNNRVERGNERDLDRLRWKSRISCGTKRRNILS